MVTSGVNFKANYPRMDWHKLVIETIGLKFVPWHALDKLVGNGKNFNFKALGDFGYSISGYEQLLKFETNSNEKKIEEYEN